ncbi:MAG: TonB-dependent receptor, partial [Opitutaceae bacterium]
MAFAPFDPALAQNPASDTRQLDAVKVAADPYKPLAPSLPRYLAFLSLPGMSLPPLSLDLGFNVMNTVVVTATRLDQAPERVISSARLLDAETVRKAPTATLDGALRGVPGFSLFRRSDSFTANPTAQGVSLRGLGPSGASRSLVLLDGVPLNDPFGGWVAWTKIPREGLSHAEVIPGGGATAWGNAALGGVMQFFTPIRTRLEITDQPPQPIAWVNNGSLDFTASLGDYGTRSGEFALVIPTRGGAVQLLG